MVKTLANIKMKSSLYFNERSISARPGLAAIVAEQIGIWAQIDNELAKMVTCFLQADFKVVTSMLHAVVSGPGREAAIEAAAVNTLSSDNLKLYRAVAKVIKPSRDVRNNFAHHVWGTTNDIPDGLLLVDPKHFGKMHASGLQARYDRQKGIESAFSGIAIKDIRVYLKTDLERARDDALISYQHVVNLRNALEHPESSTGDLGRSQLLNAPAIQQALQNPSLGNAQSTRSQRPRRKQLK